MGDVNPGDTISDIKSLLEEKTGILSAEQKLSFNGKIFKDNNLQLDKVSIVQTEPFLQFLLFGEVDNKKMKVNSLGKNDAMNDKSGPKLFQKKRSSRRREPFL